MKYKTAELEGELLNAAVSKIEGRLPDHGWFSPGQKYRCETEPPLPGQMEPYSSEWEHGGTLIEREHISLASPDNAAAGGDWRALVLATLLSSRQGGSESANATGRTPLIAAMRAYVASKYGDEVELP